MVASKSKTCCLLAKKVSKLFCTCAATPPDPRGQRSLSSRYITGFNSVGPGVEAGGGGGGGQGSYISSCKVLHMRSVGKKLKKARVLKRRGVCVCSVS